MYVYLHSERAGRDGNDLFTVGFYKPDGKWEPESDHASAELAAARVAYLNSGASPELLEARKATVPTVFSDYWQCVGCGAVLFSPTTGLAILNCWNCHTQQWRPIAKPSLDAYQVWCEERKALVGHWPDHELAAADIAIARVTARLVSQAGTHAKPTTAFPASGHDGEVFGDGRR